MISSLLPVIDEKVDCQQSGGLMDSFWEDDYVVTTTRIRIMLMTQDR